MNLDRSMQLHSTQFSPFKNRRARQLLQRDDTLNISPILNETSMLKNLNDTSLRHVLDESSILMNHGNAGDGLNEAFFEIMQSSRPSDVIDTLSRLVQACCDSLELVEPWNRYNANNYWLAEEANTWKLLHCLFIDSVTDHPDTIESIILEPTLSQLKLVEALFQSDSEVRLLQVLVDWLEATAAYQVEATQSSAPVINNDVHWSKTLHQLQIGSSFFNKDTNKNMITCMDPDAPRRQNKTIHSDDQQDDVDLCKRIFTEVRCGKFKEAISLCISAGQAWRGAILQGWRLLHYSKNNDSNYSLDITGNPSRDLWKWCCLGIAMSKSENVHYKATVGILCGYLNATLPVCHGNWEDLLWANLRVQIEMRVDKFLREHHATVHANTTPNDVLDLVQSDLKIDELSLQQVFSSINAMMEGKKESVYQTCQKHLMLGHVRAIMQEALQWLDNTNERFIRFLAHLVLVLRQMGKDPHHDIGDQVLEKYVCQLIEQVTEGYVSCPELIAYYTASVPPRTQILLYASLMDKVTKSSYRVGVVGAGIKAGIDVAAAARVAVKKAISDIQQECMKVNLQFGQNNEGQDKSGVPNVISSLEWLTLLEGESQEALWMSNAMIRTFIFIRKIDAAATCIDSLNQLLPDILKSVPSSASELREHLCLKAYLQALDSFSTWHRNFISGRPKDVEPLAHDATFTDKVHHEQRSAQVEQQKTCWMNALSHQTRHTKNLLYNVLQFPGGWLQDEVDGSTSSKFTFEEKSDRIKQLETLRSLCIPEVVLLILKILQSTNNIESHQEAIQLSNLIAAENRCLYKVFNKEKLAEFLERLQQSSYVLLDNGKDMFGFEASDD